MQGRWFSEARAAYWGDLGDSPGALGIRLKGGWLVNLPTVALGALVSVSAVVTPAWASDRSNENNDGSVSLITERLHGDGSAEVGTSVDLDGTRAIVGAPSAGLRGAAYICAGTTTPNPWDTVVDLQDLISLGYAARFGTAVSVSGDWAAVSAPWDSSGRVFLFTTITEGTWEVGPTINSPGDSAFDFGHSLSLDGHLLAIGNPAYGSNNGRVLVYDITDATPLLIATLNGSDYGLSDSEFGKSVSVHGDHIAIGAPGPLDGQGGGAYVFEVALDSSVTLIDSIAEGLHPLARFGEAVALGSSGGSLVLAVGSPGMDLNPDQYGVVEVYRDSGDGFNHESRLLEETVSSTSFFGSAVAIESDLIVVGASGATTIAQANGTASTYRYAPSNGSWTLDSTIHPIHGTGMDRFGAAVAVEGGRIVVGAPFLEDLNDAGGEAFLFQPQPDGAWQHDVRSPIPVTLDQGFFDNFGPMPEFGAEIEVDGDVALVSELSSGQVYAFQRQGPTWAWNGAQIYPPDTQNPPARFGEHVALLGNMAVVGCPYADGGGAAYVYEDVSGVGMNWILVQTITDGASGEAFGCSVELTEVGGTTWLAIGNTGNLFDLYESGEVRMYRWSGTSFYSSGVLTNQGFQGGFGSTFGGAVALAESSSGTLLVAASDTIDQTSTLAPGKVDLFEYSVGVGFIHQQAISSPQSAAVFGGTLALHNDVLAVGLLDDAQSGRVAVFERQTGLRGGRTGWLDYTFTHQLYSQANAVNGGIFDGFGSDIEIMESPRRILVSAPGLDYVQFNAGGVYVFSPDGTAYGDWNMASLLTSLSAVPSDAAGPMGVDGGTVLVGCPGADEIVPTPRRVLHYELSASANWTNPNGGSISNQGSWSSEIGALTGIFSLMLADAYEIAFDLVKWTGSIEVALNNVTFDLQSNINREISGILHVASPAAESMAHATVASGDLYVGGDVFIGPEPGTSNFYFDAGSLTVDAATVTVAGELAIADNSALVLELLPPGRRTGGAGPSVAAGAISAAGTLTVGLPGDLTGDEFAEGDVIELLHAVNAPMAGSFDVIVLPGLPNGLAFQLSTGPGFRGGSGDILIATVVSLSGLLDFGDPNSTSVSGDPTAVEVVDLTGDAAEEICVTLAGAPGSLVIFENDGLGGVSQQIVIPTGDEPVDITSGDFDCDGGTDLAVANNLSEDVWIFYNDDNDPSDGFTTIEDLDVDAPPTCLAGIEADYDAYGDLVVGLEDDDGDGNGLWAFYLGTSAFMPGGMTGGGEIEPGGVPVGADPSEEEDQKDHVFYGRTSDGKTNVGSKTNVTSGIQYTIDEYTVGADPGGIAAGDLNGNGQIDLSVTSTTNGTVAILLADTANPGAFLSAIFVPIGDDPTSVTAIDFDGDGNVDIASVVREENPISGAQESLVRVLQGDGNLAFTSIDTAENENVVLVDSGDVSGDGVNELITIGDGGSFRMGGPTPLLTLRSTDEPTCPGDFDGSGSVDINDILTLLGEFGSCTEDCQGDMDGNGFVDIDDLLELINVWGPCDR